MSNIIRILDIMARLRDKDSGCPWDLQQDFASIAPYTIEEAYEVADAIERGNLADLKDELGDLLLQVVFHAQMASEEGAFDFADVVDAISDKMTRRHPHVFADGDRQTAATMPDAWEAHKALERDAGESVLDGVAQALPALMRAEKLGKRAARVGFDWPAVEPVVAKVQEELAELQACAPDDHAALTEEIGDVLFSVVNLARHHGVDPEVALRGANRKFERRFRAVERAEPPTGAAPDAAGLARMEAAWAAAKRRGL